MTDLLRMVPSYLRVPGGVLLLSLVAILLLGKESDLAITGLSFLGVWVWLADSPSIYRSSPHQRFPPGLSLFLVVAVLLVIFAA